MSERSPLSNKDIAIYLVGAYLTALFMFGGLGVMLSSWRMAIGGTMVFGTVLAAFVLAKGA